MNGGWRGWRRSDHMRKLKAMEVFSHRQKQSFWWREPRRQNWRFYRLFWKSGGCREEQLAWTKMMVSVVKSSSSTSPPAAPLTAIWQQQTLSSWRRTATRFLPTNKQEASDTARLSERRRAETGRDWINESLTSNLWRQTNSRTNSKTSKTEICSISKGQFTQK